jgi:type IV pilus assembly protein PilO
MAHLQGLPQKVNEARDDATHFYETRIAPNYSTILEELGAAAVKNQVRLARAQYAPSPAIDGLTEVRIDAGLSGDYAPMMHFINDLERDKNHVFFIIDGLTFTGQQGGLVNLRLRLSTYLQAGATDLPPATGTSSGPGENEAATTQQTQQEVR